MILLSTGDGDASDAKEFISNLLDTELDPEDRATLEILNELLSKVKGDGNSGETDKFVKIVLNRMKELKSQS